MSSIVDPLTTLAAAQETLEHTSGLWMNVLTYATAAVVVGILVEVVATVIEVRRDLSEGKKPKLHHYLTFIGSAIVVLSCGAEYVAESRGATAETALRENNSQTGGILSDRANKATADAVAITRKFGGLHDFVLAKEGELDASVATLARANDMAVSSRKSVETALAATRSSQQALDDATRMIQDTERQVHDLTTPRVIDIGRVGGSLKKFGKVPFVIGLSDDHDAASLAAQIGAALEKAGWEWRENKRSDNALEFGKNFAGKPFMRVKTLQGIDIQVADVDLKELEGAAIALVTALKAEQLKDVSGSHMDDQYMKDQTNISGVIHVQVGTRD
jgi:hypothetical protein